MKKKSNSYQNFLLRTNSINYRDTAKIIERFNTSVHLFKRFMSVLRAGDDELASYKLHEAATTIYQCVEWSLKNYLDHRYREMENNGEINQNERILRTENLTRKTTTLWILIEEFKTISNPNYKTVGISLDLIINSAGDVNNKPKHNASIPDPNAYRAVLSELRKIIINYLDSEAKLDLIDDTIFGEGKSWYEVIDQTLDFSDSFSYVLVVNRLNNINFQGLFSIKWDMILDFDTSSDIDGLAYEYEAMSQITPWIRVLNKVDVRKNINYSNKPYWVYANGIYDNVSSIVDIGKWKNKTGKYLGDLLENFHKSYTKHVKVIMTPVGNDKATEKIAEAFTDVYDEDVDFLMLSADSDYNNIDLENFRIIDLSIHDFCDNLQIFFSKNALASGGIKYSIPTDDGNNYNLTESFVGELSDSFDVVFFDCDIKDEDNAIKTSRLDFYCGNTEISWYGIKEQFDVIRSSKDGIIKQIHEDMNDRGRLLRKVYYEPGMGGTTMLKRIAWEMRKSYPTLILKKYNEQTGKNIQKLYDLTHLPILILADNNYIDDEEIRNFQTELKRMGFAFVIVFFERKLRGKSINGSVYTIIHELTNQEVKELKNRLLPFVEGFQANRRLDLISDSSNKDEKSPFIIAMYAFDEDFKGTKPYIARYIENISKSCRKILFSLSLADYGNVPLDVEFFTDMFKDDSSDKFLLEEAPGINELVRVETNAGKKYIKIKYHLFAEEILRQLSGGYDSTEIKFNSLIDDILLFIEDSRMNKYTINQDTMNVLRNLFITRIADEDSEKPAFSPLISKLKEETKAFNFGAYDASNDAIIKIFNKLVEVYPEEAHFTAHLARYYFYIDKNYDKGFMFINKAIELSETMDNGVVDPLLYHMKAMGYASLIGNNYIPQLYKTQYDNINSDIPELIIKIEEAANNAFQLFKKVRESNIGLAGHVSEINLCIKIVNMAKNKMDESEEFNKYILSTNGQWAMKYVDRAMDLWDECKKMITDVDTEDFNNIEVRLKQLVSNLEQRISLWENYLLNSTGANRTQARRILARAYEQQNNVNKDEELVQSNLKRIVELMQENMDEESNQPGNIRLWFEAIMKIKSDNQESLIMDAIIKLNKWIFLTDSIEAYYYRFVLKFIQAMQGSTLAENELPKLLRELKNKSVNLYNRTVPQHWLANINDGLGALISNSKNKKDIIPEDEMASSLTPLVGRISNNYVNENHAYIKYKGVEVYFNPSATKGEISKVNINQRVKFGIGFSFDGPRAYNSSIKLLGVDEFTTIQEPLKYGKIVFCEVIKNVAYYTQVRIVGYGENGSIHINEYIEPYSENNRPKEGTVFEGRVLAKKYDNKKNQDIWNITMNIKPENVITENSETVMSRALKDLKID